MAEEQKIQAAIRASCGSEPGVVLYRNQSGQAVYTNKATGRTYTVPYGLAPGGSDLIGWRSVEITPEMVGQRVAVFVAIEVKAPVNEKKANKKEKQRQEQQKMFVALVERSGGLAGVARSEADARKILGLP